ncbi:MAG TPA: permease prefix domain 1-containing protein, partial [Bryobacteraceae bacterium]|nr:permease prefix domain 1-containing protein [Bryobacteraceae bacterium]
MRDLLYRLRALFRRRAVEAEIEEEMRFHRERAVEKDAPMSREEAARRARLAFGAPGQVREECREARGTRSIEDFVRDLRYGLRTLGRSPVFALTAAVTIALGIGASTAIFSVADTVLLRPLPYKDADRLVLAFRENRTLHTRNFLYSNADFLDLRNGTNTIFEDMGGVASFRAFVQRADGSADQISKALVTANFFRLMGARIAFGRDFTEADAQP